MIEPQAKAEYKFLKFSTHNEAEKGLNQMVAEGWQLVSYQAAGDSSFISHFIIVSKETRPERRMGFA